MFLDEIFMYEASLRCSPTLSYTPNPAASIILPQKDTGIVDSGATHLYISLSAPHRPPNTSDSQISAGTENGQVERLSATYTLPILKFE